jgi:hypothetical protein
MTDDKLKVGEPHPSRMSADRVYDVSQLIALKHGLTKHQVRDLVARVGNDRDKLDRAAGELSGRW